MKRILTYIFIILLFLLFTLFTLLKDKSFDIISIITPTQIVVDFNKNGIQDSDETICIENVEAFSIQMDEDFYEKYSKKFNLTRNDMINLGYMADEFSNKTLSSKKVKIKFRSKLNSKCRYAKMIVDDTDYSKILLNSGYGIINNKIGNLNKFKQNLKISKNLNLVILNHHSNKYHKLDCEFGKLAHDTVIIPVRQLPPDVVPCKYCHKTQVKDKKLLNRKKNDVYNIPDIKTPMLILNSGDITIFHTDYTKHLKPNNRCESDMCRAFIKLIDNSTETIDIAIYGYENIPDITNALENAKSRGVRIRFVYDEYLDKNKTFYKDNYIISNIADISKSDIKIDGAKLMHNKFVIFDNKIVYTGSMNFSSSGVSGYDVNDIIIIYSNEIANLYSLEFEQMLNGKFHNFKHKHNHINKFKLGDSVLEVYFSPKDKTATRLIQLIKSAKKFVYVPTFLITHKDIANALIEAHSRGIDVKIIIDANSTSTRHSKHQQLRNSGIPLKVENYAGKLHSKGMIIDDSYIVVGSMNFSNSGENKNDENLIIIQNYQLAVNYHQFFNYLWNKIPDKYLKFNPQAESKDSIGSCYDGVDNNFNGKIDREETNCK